MENTILFASTNDFDSHWWYSVSLIHIKHMQHSYPDNQTTYPWIHATIILCIAARWALLEVMIKINGMKKLKKQKWIEWSKRFVSTLRCNHTYNIPYSSSSTNTPVFSHCLCVYSIFTRYNPYLFNDRDIAIFQQSTQIKHFIISVM